MKKTVRRFWFPVVGHIGIGVSAKDRAEADHLATAAAKRLGWNIDHVHIIEDIDVRNLDQNHVIPNMGSPSFIGVWYPRL